MTLPTPHPNPLPQGGRGSNRSLRGWRAKSRRGRSPRVLNGEAMPFTRGTALHPAMPLSTPHPDPDPLPQGERGSSRSLRGWRAKPRRGRSPRVLRGEAVPFTRGTTLHQVMRLPTPHPNPPPQGGRGSNRSRRGSRAKPHRGRSPRVLRGEAVPLRRGAAFARQ